MRHTLVLAALFLSGCASSMSSDRPEQARTAALSAPARQSPLPAPPRISEPTLKGITQTLSADSFEGRAPGTPGEEKTVALLIDRFQRAGLRPGNNGNWTQDVPLVEIETQAPTPLMIAGGQGAPIALRYRDDMVIATNRVVPRIDLQNSELVFVGYGMNAPERRWNDYEGVDVRGKTVVILVNDPDWETPGLEGPFGGRAMTYYGRWTYKYEEAARQGAAAAIIVHQTEPAAYGWNVVQSSWTGPQFGFDTPDGHADQSEAIGWITQDAAQRVMRAAGQDLAALTARAKQPGFRAVPLGVTASASFTNRIARSRSRNVVGVLPGRTRPDEVVLYTAHWDHLGRCDAVRGDDICNGAVDNATGMAALVALAEAHAAAGPAERSILFLAVTAEESGLLGSEYYAANPIYPLAQTAGGVNMDALNMNGATRNIVLIGGGKSELEGLLESDAQAQGRRVDAEPTPEKGFYYRSDHFSFAKEGVPMLYFESGEDLVNGGVAAGRAAAQDYETNRYHAPDDEYDTNWDWAGAIQDVQLIYTVGRQLADGGGWPNWNADAEFRAIRDRSRAGAR